jgi:hypothetical protein
MFDFHFAVHFGLCERKKKQGRCFFQNQLVLRFKLETAEEKSEEKKSPTTPSIEPK